MTTIMLVPWAQTDWQAAGRWSSTTALTLNEPGQQQITRWSTQAAELAVCAVYGPELDPGASTADLLARDLGLKSKKLATLSEVSLGLWEGLTEDDLKKRFSKTFKQWKEDPSSVCPPEGEDLSANLKRLTTEIDKLARKNRGQCFAVILGPITFAAIRCHLESRSVDELWQLRSTEPVHYELHLEDQRVLAGSSSARS